MQTGKFAIASVVALLLALPVAAQTTTKPMDANKDGKVTAKERRDTNKDGKVSKQEKQAARSKSEERFRAADTNKDGGLSREELKNTKGFERIERNFDAMDTNRDGKVTLEERRAFGKARSEAKKAQRAKDKAKN